MFVHIHVCSTSDFTPFSIYIQVNNNHVIRENDYLSLRVNIYHYRIVYVSYSYI